MMEQKDMMDTTPPSPDYYYMVTAHKSTAVTHSIRGDMRGDGSVFLVLAKTTRLEVYVFTEGQLMLLCEVPVFGRVENLCFIRLPGSNTDTLFILTDQLNYGLFNYNEATKDLIAFAHGNIRERTGVRDEGESLVAYDSQSGTMVIRTHLGMLKICQVGLNGLTTTDTFLSASVVHASCFMPGYDSPTLALLITDYNYCTYLQTYQVDTTTRTIKSGPWAQTKVESGASMLLPIGLPKGGVIVVGENTIAHCYNGQSKAIPIQATIMCASTIIDPNGSRHLLSDYKGTLSVLWVQIDNSGAVGLRLERLGEASIASSMVYLGDNTIFIGSTLGDSQLLQVNSTIDKALVSKAVYTNLGPIVDLCIIDYEGLGQGQVVTCSGSDRNGSLRIVRNGIGVSLLAEIEIGGIAGVWSVKASTGVDQYDILCLVTANHTYFMVTGNDADLISVGENDAALVTDVYTILCAPIAASRFVHVTEKSVRLMQCQNLTQDGLPQFTLLWEWVPSNGKRINLAVCNGTHLLVSQAGGIIVLVDVSQSECVVLCQQSMPHEVACLAIGPPAPTGEGECMCAIGLWNTMAVHILSIPSLSPLCVDALGTEILPRSLLFAKLEEQSYLLCALGDGSLLYYHITEAGYLTEKRKVTLGTKAIDLVLFTSSNNSPCVFAACDKPTVIHSSRNKLLFSSVNIKDINHVCTFNTLAYRDCLVLVSDVTMSLATLDVIQKLHIRTIPLGVSPLRICHMAETNTIAVITCHTTVTTDYEEIDKYSIRLFNHKTFNGLDEVVLPSTDAALCMAVYRVVNQPTPFYAVGTAIIDSTSTEAPAKGRITLFGVNDGKLVTVSSTEVEGGVYSLTCLPDRLCAGIDGQVVLFRIDHSGSGQLQLVQDCCCYAGNLCQCLDTQDSLVLVGDQLRSVSVLHYTPGIEPVLKKISRDHEARMISAISLISPTRYLLADKDYNMVVITTSEDGILDEKQGLLEVTAAIHTGECINCFKKGSLVLRLDGDVIHSDDCSTQSILFATVSGGLGTLLPISKGSHTILSEVYQRLTNRMPSTGMPHGNLWRKQRTGTKTWGIAGIIDGDVIETILDWSRERLSEVFQDIWLDDKPVSIDDVMLLVESLSRSH